MNYDDCYRAVNDVIEKCLGRGRKRFIIYPFGVVGNLVKQILNTAYGIEEIALIDNKLSVYNRNIYKAADILRFFWGGVERKCSDYCING